MKTLIKLTVSFACLIYMSCEKSNNDVIIKSYLDSIDTEKYYVNEIIPDSYQNIYGTWKLFAVSGGYSGTGHEVNFDYLEIKSIGIYGLVRNDSLFEYGKIELDTFDAHFTDMLQIKLMPDFYTGLNPYMHPNEKYVNLPQSDSLDLFSPCCDMFNYHFRREK
jgi:hypothetical protein